MGHLSAGVRQLPYRVVMVAQRGVDVHVRRPDARESLEAAPRASTYPSVYDAARMTETIYCREQRTRTAANAPTTCAKLL